MIKKITSLFLLFCFCSCSPDAIEDCFTSAGNTETREIELAAFDKITIRKNIELQITYSENQQISIEAGSKKLNDIILNLKEDHLEIKANDLCASGFKNPPYIIHLKTPNLKEIRNSSQFKVQSKNTLHFDELTLISENYNDNSALAIGDFNLDLNTNELFISHAGISDFYLKGTSNYLNIGFYTGSGRIFGESLVANKIDIYHRGFGDVHVFPIEEISGELLSTGNLILHNNPMHIDVDRLLTGQIIFKNE
mgnify:CR=1 FL=1